MAHGVHLAQRLCRCGSAVTRRVTRGPHLVRLIPAATHLRDGRRDLSPMVGTVHVDACVSADRRP